MKRGEVGTALVLIIIVVALFLGYVYNLGFRDCHNNDDCKEEQYCGSDFACHDYPSAVARSGSGLLWPSVIIGVSIVIAALILRWKKGSPREGEALHDFSDLQR